MYMYINDWFPCHDIVPTTIACTTFARFLCRQQPPMSSYVDLPSSDPFSLKVLRLSEDAKLPARQSDKAAGFDLHATSACVIAPGTRALIKTGIAVEFPPGCFGSFVRTLSFLNGLLC